MMDSGRLRPLTSDDLVTVLAWRNQYDVRRFMYTNHEITLSEHLRWFDAARLDPSRHLMVYTEKDIPSGYLNISLSVRPGIADWGFYLAPGAALGTGSRLGKLALSYAFADLKLHKLRGEVLSNNVKSLKFHRKLGFSEEGVLREEHWDGEKYHNIVYFGLLRSEWNSKLFEVT